MTEINPCPFCGSHNVEFVDILYRVAGHVVCRNWRDECCARGPEVAWREGDTEESVRERAIAKWNRA